jgi:hypothetical protein
MSENVVVLDEEKARRVINEAERLSRQSVLERNFWMKKSAERLGIPLQELKALVEARVKEWEKEAAAAKAEERRQEQRAEKQREREEKQRTAAERADERKRKSEQETIDKAAQAKEKAKQKALADIAKLPVAQHEIRLAQLATKLDLELPELCEEFAELIAEDKDSSEPSLWDVEPWLQPVSTAELLAALVSKYAKHIAAEPHEILTLALWAMMTWVYQDAARHSTFLLLTSPDPVFGKTTALEVLNFTVLRPSLDTDITGPTLYRFIDQMKPTMLMDETETLFKRPDIKAIILKSHSRLGTIKRQERIQGRSVTVQFSPWCPKVFALVDLDVPLALITRSIVIQLWAKLPDSQVKFDRVDDEEFLVLRQKSARWASDYVTKLKDAKEPLFPAGFDNRPADLWRLLLLISEFAGSDWAKQARKAAERLSRFYSTPSWRRLLLQSFAKIAGDGRKYVLSEELHNEVLRDPTSPFHEYENKRGRIGKITQRQIAHLLRPLGIPSAPCGPQRLQGYLVSDSYKSFRHYRISSSPPRARKE